MSVGLEGVDDSGDCDSIQTQDIGDFGPILGDFGPIFGDFGPDFRRFWTRFSAILDPILDDFGA